MLRSNARWMLVGQAMKIKQTSIYGLAFMQPLYHAACLTRDATSTRSTINLVV